MADDHKSSPIHLILAIAIAILIFLNVLLGIAYLLIPKDCLRGHPSASPTEDSLHPRHHYGARYPPRGYEMRSFYVAGPEGRQVAIINGFVQVDDDFDAWAYWATDSEETLRGIPLNTSQQYGIHNGQRVAVSDEYAYQQRQRHAQESSTVEFASDSIVTRVPGQRGVVVGLSAAGYEFEQPMEFASQRAVARAPPVHGVEAPPAVHSPTVRTWGRDSDATIRAVVESPRREVAGLKEKSCGGRA
ncbi:hypothetical protein TARUN_6201 [Trichoderma arundinaceum]|uniref:Uncharacterized protein n=1 Tax=Trichoderma arundinaceum TaxID=490622 RepID=A0A395NJ23_TRIAR|nr:hypothetical protein TARUN_6201 [Trichoderma arundinaceum]